MARIELENVDLTFRIFDYRGQSLRLKLLDYAVGGRFETNKAVTQVHALKNLNLFIQEGNAIGLYGHNGSGKTSFLRLLSNIYAPTRGRCFIEGKQRSLLSVSVGMEPSLSGRENLYRIGLLNGFTYDEIRGYEDNIIVFSELGEYINFPARTYSSGMSMRLLFSIATCVSSDILLIDEFFSTGDEGFIEKSETRLKKLISNSKILVFASHSKSLIKQYCNRVLLFDHGSATEIDIRDF